MNPEDHPLGSNYSNGANSQGGQIDQLDALLTARRAGRSTSVLLTPNDLAPLLAAADALAPLADARPSAEFANRLEARLLARVEAHASTLPMTVPPPERHERRSIPARPRRRSIQPTWAAIAACVMLAMTVGALTASAHPGAPFYPLRKVVEGIGADLNGGPAAIARDNLQRASAALAAFNTAASQGDSAAAQTALGQLTQADRQAADAIAQVDDSAQKASLQSQLDNLRAQETSGLRAALPNLNWPARIQTTSALRGLRATTLAVTSARMKGASGTDSGDSGQATKSSGIVTVIVNGVGFTPGAVLLINGQPAGVVDAVTPQMLTAHLPAGALSEDVTSIGVGEPDGSAASTTHIESDEHTPEGTTTPDSGDHSTPGPDSTPGHGSGDGGESTPSPQPTNGVTPTPTGDH